METETNFYDGIVKNLKDEAKKLNDRLNFLMQRPNAMNEYIATLKSLRETLDLISKYDWQLNYSEYEVCDQFSIGYKQVSVWEQNHEGQIRNHKIWDVIDKDTK